MKIENNKIAIIIFVAVFLLVVVQLFFLDDVPDKAVLCSPGLFCLDGQLAYRDLTCGVLVDSKVDNGEVCEDNRFVEESELFERVVWNENVPTIVIRDPEGDIFEWEYFEGEAEAREHVKIGFSPPEVIFAESFSSQGVLIGKEDSIIYIYIQGN